MRELRNVFVFGGEPDLVNQHLFKHAQQATGFIDGGFVPSGAGDAVPIINPADESQLGVLYEADSGQVDDAVSSAQRVFEKGVWRDLPVASRQNILRNIHDLILAHTDELAYLESLNTGLTYAQLRGRHVPRAAYNFSFFDIRF